MEMILTGRLKAIEEGEAKQEWIDYYCQFVIFLRPEIMTEIKKYRDSAFFDDENYKKAYKLLGEGRAEEGLGVIRNFLEQHPLVSGGWFILGWALRLLSRWSDGEAAFRKAIELGGDNSDTRNELAICLMEKGDIEGARQELETALKIDPENEKIISNLQVVDDVIRKESHAEAQRNDKKKTKDGKKV
jgi:Flp pilus assembly protein TadD